MNIFRHGELVLKETTLPKNAQLKKETNKEIVAHSETGHHHILETLDMSNMKFYMSDGKTYIELPSLAKLWHKKTGKDTHKTHEIKPAVYEIILKKEFDYYKGVLKIVRD